MHGLSDRLVITNTATGDVLYDSGRVTYKRGSGAVVPFDLGKGNDQITITVNPGASPTSISNFKFSIVVTPDNENSNNSTIVFYSVD